MGITGRTRTIGLLAKLTMISLVTGAGAGASACVFQSGGLGAGQTTDGADTTGGETDPDATTIAVTSAASTGGGGSGSGGGLATTAATTSVPGSTGDETTGCTPLDWFPDGDEDGYGAGAPMSACEQPVGHVGNNEDCDDDAPAVHPSAAEICDEIDNDCDGQVDEFAAASNNECGGCSLRAWGDSQYAFCDVDRTWEKARAHCLERDSDLVIIEDEAEFEFLRSELQVRAGEWWIGASDLEQEGEFRWHDDAPLAADDDRWAWSQPDNGVGNNNNGDEDCVVFGGANSPVKGEWHDTDCEVGTLVGATRPLCESPWSG